MSNLDDRIRALDPYATASYEHADATSMVERITSVAPQHRHRRRLAVLLAPVTAVAAAGLAVGGLLVTAGTVAQPLPALSLHVAGGEVAAQRELQMATNGAAFAFATRADASSFVRYSPTLSAAIPVSTTPAFTYLYELGTQLPTTSPALDAYQAIGPANPIGLLAAGAQRLGVHGTVKRVATSTWQLGTIKVPSAVEIAVLNRSASSGLYEFRFLHGDLASPPSRCSAGASTAVDTDRLAMTTSLSRLLASLGLHYELQAPTFQTTWSSTRHGCTGTVVLDTRLLVHGAPTDQSVHAAFDPTGALVGASLPVFTIGRAVSYPLVSPVTAADALVQSTADFGATVRVIGGTSHRPGHGRPTAPGTPRSLMIVELRTSTIALRAFATTSNTSWLLPVYALTGDGYTALAARPTTWSGNVVATASPLVRIRGARGQSHAFDVAP